MNNVSIRELRNQGKVVVDRVLAGEHLTVTRDGEPVAELRPLPRRGLDAAMLLRRWKHLPQIDSQQFRRDVDEVLDTTL